MAGTGNRRTLQKPSLQGTCARGLGEPLDVSPLASLSILLQSLDVGHSLVRTMHTPTLFCPSPPLSSSVQELVVFGEIACDRYLLVSMDRHGCATD
jgi:hypothetical protein